VTILERKEAIPALERGTEEAKFTESVNKNSQQHQQKRLNISRQDDEEKLLRTYVGIKYYEFFI
jgi:hypothetical protein